MEIQIIQNKIYEIRGQRVMLDYDLAEMYGIETKVLNQAVKRNINRFPSDFMFQLTNQEVNNLRSQIVTSSWGGYRYLPFAFTEHGVTMLASVLRSPVAIEINIQIVRAFIVLRQFALNNQHLIQELEDIKKQIKILQDDVESLSQDHNTYEDHFDEIYVALTELAKTNPQKEKTSLPKVGYLK